MIAGQNRACIAWRGTRRQSCRYDATSSSCSSCSSRSWASSRSATFAPRRSASTSRAASRSCSRRGPRRARSSATRTSTARSRSSASAWTRSASPSRRSAARSRTRSSSTWPASSTRPRRLAHRPDRPARVLRPPGRRRPALVRRHRAIPSRARRSSRSSRAEDKLPEGDDRARVVPLRRGEAAPRRPGGDEGGAPAAGRGRRGARGLEFYVVPSNQTILTCGASRRRDRAASRARAESRPRRPWYYLYKYQPNDAENPIPELTGEDLSADDTRQDFDSADRAADRPPRLHRRGRRQVPRHHARGSRSAARQHAALDGITGSGEERAIRPELRHRARRRDPLLPDHRLHRP